MRITIAMLLALTAGACKPAAQGPAASALPTVPVMATAETEPVGTAREDAADDPAIWRNAADPAASLIVATDKKAGLHVYGLGGKSLAFDPAGRLNNVDLIDLGERGILVAASDRNDEANAKVQLYRLDPNGPKLIKLGAVSGGKGEAYGICLAPDADGGIHAFSVLKQGRIEQVAISYDGKAATGKTVRSLKVPSQPEGCVVDTRTNRLFIGEEKAGIWQFDSRAEGPAEGKLVARVDGKNLVADVEGLAISPEGADAGWLIASSQGDNSFVVFRLPDMALAGRFRITKGQFGSVEETDGIALALGDFGPAFPGGLFVAQDGENQPSAQNFKLVPWSTITEAVKPR
ncbi:phytase [Sphingomonas sp. NSE70-1]|uniref:Phytase n=1 Tax=Sphingomonas caseinilyticus TaxID=2908205 RepID=A0ABT0RUL3_9SPHN|nr:phytase [Sphingomonas caseinilyticus]MCL6698679.1 phytase [Sphingomonas caseinilyticus]